MSDFDDYMIFLSDNTTEFDRALPEKLAERARDYKIPVNATSALLAILNDDHPSSPTDALTLLATPVHTDIKKWPVVNLIILESSQDLLLMFRVQLMPVTLFLCK